MKAWMALLMGVALPATAVELANSNTPWRAFLVTGPKLMADGEGSRIVDYRARDPWRGVAFDPSGTNAAHFCDALMPGRGRRWSSRPPRD